PPAPSPSVASFIGNCGGCAARVVWRWIRRRPSTGSAVWRFRCAGVARRSRRCRCRRPPTANVPHWTPPGWPGCSRRQRRRLRGRCSPGTPGCAESARPGDREFGGKFGEDRGIEVEGSLALVEHPAAFELVDRQFVEQRAVFALEGGGIGDIVEDVEAHAVA